MRITLEISRVEGGTDPFEFVVETQAYRRQTERIDEAELPWRRLLEGPLPGFHRGALADAERAEFGDVLRSFLEGLGWDETAVLDASGERRIVTLRSFAAEIYALPWELTRLGPGGGTFAGSTDVVLHYETPGAAPVRPRAKAGRPALMAWAGALTEVAGHKQALASAYAEFNPDADVLAHATFDGLKQALRDDCPEVLHVLCHGTILEGAPALAWQADDGGSDAVTAGRFADILAPHLATLRTVVLCVCSVGVEPLGTRLGSFARALHQRGVRAVIGSRTLLTQEGSTAFAAAFHRRLGAGATLADAFVDGRYALAGRASLDPFAVQLHARAADVDRVEDAGPSVAFQAGLDGDALVALFAGVDLEKATLYRHFYAVAPPLVRLSRPTLEEAVRELAGHDAGTPPLLLVFAVRLGVELGVDVMEWVRANLHGSTLEAVQAAAGGPVTLRHDPPVLMAVVDHGLRSDRYRLEWWAHAFAEPVPLGTKLEFPRADLEGSLTAGLSEALDVMHTLGLTRPFVEFVLPDELLETPLEHDVENLQAAKDVDRPLGRRVRFAVRSLSRSRPGPGADPLMRCHEAGNGVLLLPADEIDAEDELAGGLPRVAAVLPDGRWGEESAVGLALEAGIPTVLWLREGAVDAATLKTLAERGTAFEIATAVRKLRRAATPDELARHVVLCADSPHRLIPIRERGTGDIE